MFKKAIFALTVATTLAGTALTVSAPAEAHDWLPNNGFIGHHWNYGNHWDHYPHHFYGPVFYAPTGGCYWTWRTERVWTNDGPEFVKHRVQTCD